MNTLISKGGPRRRVLNPRAAIILAVVVGIGVTGMRRLHDKQFSATVQFLRNMAFKSLERGEFRDAQQQLTQYLAMKSGDREAREKLSEILSENIRTSQALQQAFRLNEDLLRLGAGNDALRLRHAKVAIKLNLMADADAHLKMLLISQPDNAEIWYLNSVTATAARDMERAISCLKRSIRCPEKFPDAYAALAKLATDESALEFQPDALMQQMIEQCPTAKAYRLRAAFLMNSGRSAEAITDLWAALSESPYDPALNAMLVRCLQSFETDAIEKSSSAEQSTKMFRRAIEHLEEQVKKTPQSVTLRRHLAAVLWKFGQRSKAIQTLEEGISLAPLGFALHQTLIEYLASTGNTEKAKRVLDNIPAGGLSQEVRDFCRGRIFMEEGHWKDAAAAFELALAFGKKESETFSRAQLSLAVCRSRCGEAGAALESFRIVAAENPESVPARLGMASAWVSAGQLELAIAEYRQLQDVKGVSACLVDLLIRKNLQQPPSLRSWDEIDAMLRDDDPVIPDPVQRILLRTDRLFAAGEIIPAINTLENASIRHSNRPEILAALRRVQGDYAPQIRDRLKQLASEDPENPEIRAALIRQRLSDGNRAGALAAVEEVSQSESASSARREKSLVLTIETINHLIAMEQRMHRIEFIADFENAASAYAGQLVSLNPVHEYLLIRSLVRSGKTDDAIRHLRQTLEPGHTEVRAAALLELVRSSSSRDSVLAMAIQELYSLILRHPQNPELRFYYADLLLFAREYSIADQVLESLQSLSSDGRIGSRRAWILAVQGQDLARAQELALSAVRADSQEPVFREVQARVFLARKEFETALEILRTIPRRSLSLAGQTYLAAALVNLNRPSEAQAAFDRIHSLNDMDALFPADEDMLKSIRTQVLPPATAQR